MSLVKHTLAILALLGLVASASAETIGPGGEEATPSSSVVVGDEKVAMVQAKGYSAALLWHDQSDFVNAVTAGAATNSNGSASRLSR